MGQLSLLEIARHDLPGATDEERIAALCAHIINDLQLRPPVDPLVVASYQGIRGIKVVASPWAGSLYREDGALVIQVRAADSSRRRRFTALHEVGHTLQPGFSVVPRFRCDSGPRTRRRPRDEVLSDVSATELLLPRRFIERELVGAPFGMWTVQELADRYEASLEATARRVVDLWPEDALLVVLEVETKPSEDDTPGATPRLRARYAHGHGRWPFIPPHKSVAQGSLLDAVVQAGEVRGPSGLDGLAMGFDGEAELSAIHAPFIDPGGRTHQRVLALFRSRQGSRSPRKGARS